MLKKLMAGLLCFGLALTMLLAVGRLAWLPTVDAAQAPQGPRAASAAYQLEPAVVGQGSTTMHSGSYELHGTVGQTAVTSMQGDTYSMQNGYWHAVRESIFKVLLPLIRKE